MLGDVNGDGKEDIVAFGSDAVYLSFSTGSGFTNPIIANSSYTYNSGWRTDKHLRFLADVNGDDRQDIVGFAGDGVYVSFSAITSFLPAQRVLTGYG
ncbi:MAG: VCBS repeat-containing protein [Deinococcales bacterium]